MNDTKMSNVIRKKRPRKLLPHLCRICMTGSSSMSNLNEFLDTNETISILGALEKVMGCEIITSGQLPDHVCSMCISLLRISYDLKIQFNQTQRKLVESLNKINEIDEETNKQSGKSQTKSKTEEKTKKEVDLIYGHQSYSLDDILIVEDDEERQEDYSEYLKKLGHTVSLECISKSTEKTDDPIATNFEDVADNQAVAESTNIIETPLENVNYETIVIQAECNEEESSVPKNIPFHWEHAYAKNSDYQNSVIRRRAGRNSKYPQELMDAINSLIIEGEPQDEYAMKYKRRKRCTTREMQEIEKYIIYIGDENENKVADSQTNTRTQRDDFPCVKDNLSQSSDRKICNICNESFVSNYTLQRHLRVVHKINLPPKPKRERMSREAQIRRRVEMTKLKYKKNPNLCQICGYVSKSSGGARYHQLTHSDKKFQCDLCPKRFYTPSHLKFHRDYKHGQKPKHLCSLCGEYKNSKSALNYHMTVHTGQERNYKCHICDKKFLVQSALNTHLRRHNGERPFPCQLCNKSFYSANELRKHIMTHTGERPYKCNYCDKAFVTPFNRKIHMLTHDGAFSCEFCQRTFIDSDVLNMHMKHKHHISTQDLTMTMSNDEDDSNDAQILDGLDLLPLKDDNLDFD